VGREEKGGETEAEGGGRSRVEGRRRWEPAAPGARAGCNSPGWSLAAAPGRSPHRRSRKRGVRRSRGGRGGRDRRGERALGNKLKRKEADMWAHASVVGIKDEI